MLFKLLKYDLRAIYKYWWMCAILSIVFSVVGGVSYNILATKIDVWSARLDAITFLCIFFSALIGVIVGVMGISAFLLATEIFIFIRFYKHFFSDEGYLTFTLPVKRATLLNSKILSAFSLHLATVVVTIIGICLFVLIGIPMTNLRVMFNNLSNTFEQLVSGLGTVNVIILAFELLVSGIIMIIASYLSVLICITFGSIIVKRGKVFAAIGIYYLASNIITGISQLLTIFSYVFIPGMLMMMGTHEVGVTLWMIFIPVIILFVAVTVAMYAIELYMLDRKLNLA